jgi:hypothetical protein
MHYKHKQVRHATGEGTGVHAYFIFQTVLFNKMKRELLADFMMIYIKRKLVKDINSDSIINKLYSIKYQMVQL